MLDLAHAFVHPFELRVTTSQAPAPVRPSVRMTAAAREIEAAEQLPEVLRAERQLIAERRRAVEIERDLAAQARWIDGPRSGPSTRELRLLAFIVTHGGRWLVAPEQIEPADALRLRGLARLDLGSTAGPSRGIVTIEPSPAGRDLARRLDLPCPMECELCRPR